MNRAQKIAWFSIIVLSAVLLLTAAKTYWFVTNFGWQRADLGLCHIGLACIAGLGPLIFRKDKTQTIHTDERDYLLEFRAGFAGFAASYGFLVITGMAIWITSSVLMLGNTEFSANDITKYTISNIANLLFQGFNGTIKISLLISLMVGDYVAAELVRSIAILCQYGWTGKTSIGD